MRLFLILSVVFISHQVLNSFGFHNDFIDAYLDPFLFFPIVLFSAKKWNQRYDSSFKVSFSLAIVTFVAMTILFEIIFPALNNHFDRDYYDFIAYALGLCVYMTKMNQQA